MEPCCGIAKTAGRRAARRAIFRSGMVINVEIARIYGFDWQLAGKLRGCEFWTFFVIVDRVYCVVIVVIVVVDLEYCLKPTRAVKRG